MRSLFVLLHRWAGLLIAGFLFVSGITGAIISWDHELDDLLNPHLMEALAQGQARPSLEYVEQIEARHPQVRVSFVPLLIEPGESLAFSVSPRVNPQTGQLFEPGYNQVFIDPVSGEELGKRFWGAPWPITSENLISFLYVLHYSLHIPEMWGIDRWGVWLLGIIAVIWTLDCFVGFYLTLPSRKRQAESKRSMLAEEMDMQETVVANGKTWWQRWQPAWLVRWRGGNYKVNFDLHRAGGLWTWGLLFILAFTAFSLNLYREVFFPVMSTISQVTPGPFDLRAPAELHKPIVAKVGFEEIIQQASVE
ncbi:MAG: PepSY-associated TM helix domain-containing protein, partial [Nitrosomonadales bacterium]|nr:PepSY-associated TM helix domain-containing protein [Nitrosomonadales bacterium]